MKPNRKKTQSRRGAVLILFAILLVPMLAMVAYAVDIAYVSVVKTELQRTADAAALAGTGCLLDDEALQGMPSDLDERVDATVASYEFTALNPAGRVNLNLIDTDLTVGYIANPNDPDQFSISTYANAVRVVVRRDAVANSPLALFFAPVFGKKEQEVQAVATAIYEGAINGFHSPGSMSSSLLPYK